MKNRGVQVRVGDMEEEAVGSDEVRAEGPLLGVPPTPFHRPRHAPHPPRQGSPSRLQGQAGPPFLLLIEVDNVVEDNMAIIQFD